MKNETISIVWENINSSMINFVHYKYDATTEKSYLGVIFSSEDSYIYSGVSIKDFISLLSSESVGSAFSKMIKDKYPYKNVGNTFGNSPLTKLNEM